MIRRGHGWSGVAALIVLLGGLWFGGLALPEQAQAGGLCCGHCCLPDGSCLEDVSVSECNAESGAYDGSDISCGAAMCPVQQPAQVAPALSPFGLVLAAALLTGAGLRRLRRQQR